MESSGECRGCQRNIKFAVKQARLCRTCYNKTYLTSQKRREYYKNKKKRRETSSSVEPAIDVHRHHGKSIKKEDSQGNRSPPHTLPDNPGQDPVASHLYLLSYQSHTRSCSDCVPQAGLFASAAPSSASPAALSLAALAHASQHHASSSPASPLAGSANGSLLHHLSSATTTSSSPCCSPASSPPLSVASRPQQVHVQYHVATHHQSMSPESASSSALVTPYGSPPTPGPVLFQDLLQQMSYYAAMAPMLGLAPVGMPTEMFATTSTTSSFSSSPSSAACGLPSLSTFFLPTSSTNPLAIPTPRYPPSTPQPLCQQCRSPAAPAQRVDTTTPEPTWLCDTCLANRHGAQPATRSPAIKNLLN